LAAALVACGHSPTDPGDGTTILFNLSTSDIVLGDSVQLTATVRDPSGNAIPNVTLAWSSADTKIATVSSDGLVKAVGMGETNIEVDATIPDVAQLRTTETWWANALALIDTPVHAAAAKHVKGKKKVVIVPNVKIIPEAATIAVGGHQAFTALITYKDGTPLVAVPTIKWDSADKTVATIDGVGYATGVKNGTTSISATVTVGSATNVVQKAPVTVSDLCDGVASVSTIRGTLDYTYEKSGDGGGAKINSKFTGSGISATLTRSVSLADEGHAQWRGPVTAGTASQVETKTYPNTDPYRLNDSGALDAAEFVVNANLNNCTYKIVATLTYRVTRTDVEGQSTGGVDVEQGDRPLQKKNDAGSYFGNIPSKASYPATSDIFGSGNIFGLSGFAQDLADPGNAQVSFTLTVTGTSGAGDRPLALLVPPRKAFQWLVPRK
jgi:hypothetical protein